jgi:hypothetical protein
MNLESNIKIHDIVAEEFCMEPDMSYQWSCIYAL